MNKKTTTEYIEEAKLKSPTLEVIGEYINAKTKILHKCKICGKELYLMPTNVLKGCACKSCSLKKVFKEHPRERLSLRKTHEQYINELHMSNPNIILLDRYITGENVNHFKCKICGYEWKAKPLSYLRGKGCFRCGKQKMASKNTHSNQYFLKKLYNLTTDIIPLEEYQKNNLKILVKCKKCGRIWNALPSSLLSGHGCECSKLKIDDKTFDNILKQNNIKILETKDSDIICKCQKCGYIWTSKRKYIIRNQGCKKCVFDKKCLTNETFIEKLKETNPYIIPLDTYKKGELKIRLKCKKCGHVWSAKARNILIGCGCPKCNFSRGELNVSLFLDSNNIDYIGQYKYDNLNGVGGKLLSYDFYLPQYNILIEFQGKQHFKPIDHFGGKKKFVIQQIHDIRKRRYAKENNIRLISIWYNEINKIPQTLKQYINNLNLESVTTVILPVAI